MMKGHQICRGEIMRLLAILLLSALPLVTAAQSPKVQLPAGALTVDQPAAMHNREVMEKLLKGVDLTNEQKAKISANVRDNAALHVFPIPSPGSGMHVMQGTFPAPEAAAAQDKCALGLGLDLLPLRLLITQRLQASNFDMDSFETNRPKKCEKEELMYYLSLSRKLVQ